MGLLVKHRPRAQLDSDVLAGLAVDETARSTVKALRSNGYEIMLSPTVVREIVHAGGKRRARLLKAILEQCDGFTTLQAPEVLRMEVEALLSRRQLPDRLPVLPIEELRSLRSEAEILRKLGDFAKPEHDLDAVAILDGLAQAMKGESVGSFKDFLLRWLGPLAQEMLDRGQAAGWAPRVNWREHKSEDLGTMKGLVQHSERDVRSEHAPQTYEGTTQG